MSFLKKFLIFIVIISLIFLAISLINKKKEEIENEPTAFNYKLKEIEKENKNNTNFEIYNALLQAKENPKITSKVSGFIEKIVVKENQKIKKGETLFKIDSKEFEASLNQIKYSIQALKYTLKSLEDSIESTKLDMEFAHKQLKRNEKVHKTGGISQDKFDSFLVLYEQKKSKYKSLLNTIKAKEFEIKSQESLYKSKLQSQDYYTIASPIDGVVENIIMVQGDLINSTKTVLSLVSKEQKLSFTFANENIKKGQEVFINEVKIGIIDFISISSENYLSVANIKLIKALEKPLNSLISIKVKIK